MDDEDQMFRFWLLDTRNMWPGDAKPGSKITQAAAEAIKFLSLEEQEVAQRYFFLKDSKMSVASSLLKRLFVVVSLSVPWEQVTYFRLGDPKHGKPCYRPGVGGLPHIDFNVSHQAGLVALAGCRAGDVQLGVDIVCVNERNDAQIIKREGFDRWVEMHGEVFSESDMNAMKSTVTGASPEQILDIRMRKFYAYWALKEAYVKLEGEALLASWLKDVSFYNVRIPEAVKKQGKNVKLLPMRMAEIEVWLNGSKRTDVEMFLESYGEDYLIATAVKKPVGEDFDISPFYESLDLEKDVLPYAATL